VFFFFTFSPTNEKQLVGQIEKPKEPDDEEECIIFRKIKFCRKTTKRQSHGKWGDRTDSTQKTTFWRCTRNAPSEIDGWLWCQDLWLIKNFPYAACVFPTQRTPPLPIFRPLTPSYF